MADTVSQLTSPAPGTAVRPDDGLRVQARDIVKEYRSKKGTVTALRGVSLDIAEGEMAVLLGPSGCGKTTLLRSIAGLEKPQGGEVRISGRRVYSAKEKVWVPPERRALSMVFQSYALWPHMTVFQNIAFPLESRKEDKASTARRVRHVMEAVHLGKYGDRYPGQLSGGQQQRVALARAIVADVDVILFDEPLSNVDAKVREEIRKQIVELQSQFGFAGLYVTHDQIEAGALATRLVVMNHGEISQSGAPQQLYDRPDSRYVAGFMGTLTEIGGTARRVGERTVVDTALGPVVGHAADGVAPGSPVVAAFRPEWATLSDEPGGADHNVWQCLVKHKMFMGSSMEVIVELQGSDGTVVEATVTARRGSGFREGSVCHLHVPAEQLRILPE